ncbi:HutD family protein [Moellerella wisconsensis]|uniref:HutD family protein n=2 Tax=Moellerella wisconsensis TaxID=158849 RepID=A0A9Q8V5B2_9GAMM|nr:HutD family protein [Moellerella wisconsensis]KLN97365.1 hypothetical protein VK86_05850 [Moellerella wisconsensis]UNH28619.1 HutD family protein [Moellerella wisconsensis]UNH32072.1 HutD family protein [Moellerella wisconsensis]UNH40227.1 HutD family protein [Moellerella wisconsensis]UNH43763.1 HutD family protein [Moellerella wisconsensis]
MKIRCFDGSVNATSKAQQQRHEIVCWPVASDFSWCAQIDRFSQTCQLPTMPDIDYYLVLLNDNALVLTSDVGSEYVFTEKGQSFCCRGEDSPQLLAQDGPILLLNIRVRRGCWKPKITVITENQPLPTNSAGVIYVLEGHWQIQGANCSQLIAEHGCWWLPDIRQGRVSPLQPNSCLIWVDLMSG